MQSINRFSDSSYLPTLDGWRAIAILYVSFNHSNLTRMFPHSMLMRSGFVGVWVFFAISGLLITTRLLGEESSSGTISLKSFYIRRMTRLQPAALMFLIVAGILYALKQIPMDRWMVFGDVFQIEDYVDYWQGSRGDNWYGRHFWSLSVEEHFYIFLPFLLVFVVRNRLRIFAALTGAVLAWSYFMTKGTGGHETIHRTDLILTGLLVPSVFAIWVRRKGVAERFPWWLAWVCLALIPMAINRNDMVTPVRWFHLNLTLPVLFSAMIVSTVQNPESLLGRFLEFPWMRFVGRISYSLYLYQQLFFVTLLPRWPVFLGKLQRFPVDYLCAFVAALLSYYLIEKPFIRLGHAWANRVSSVRIQEPAARSAT